MFRAFARTAVAVALVVSLALAGINHSTKPVRAAVTAADRVLATPNGKTCDPNYASVQILLPLNGSLTDLGHGGFSWSVGGGSSGYTTGPFTQPKHTFSTARPIGSRQAPISRLRHRSR